MINKKEKGIISLMNIHTISLLYYPLHPLKYYFQPPPLDDPSILFPRRRRRDSAGKEEKKLI